MRIHWNTEVNAPCCPGEVVAADGRSVLIQQDTDFPGVASTFGWDIRTVQDENRDPSLPPCAHEGTDGTVRCTECGLDAIAFITDAGSFLEANDGAEAEDPGYFD